MTDLIRKRCQRGSLIDKGDRWDARWYEYAILPVGTRPRNSDKLLPDGTVERKIYRQQTLCMKVGLDGKKVTKPMAVRELRDHLLRIDATGYRVSTSITFEKFAEKWQRTVMVHHKPSAQDGEKSILKRSLLPAFGHMELGSITLERVQAFVNSWQKSPKTLRNAIVQMQGMWEYVEPWEGVKTNPFARGIRGKVLLQLPRMVKPKSYAYTLEEATAIIAAVPEKWRCFFRLLFEGGMRPGEIAGLRREDLDGRTITIVQSVYRQQIQTPKTSNAVRRFPIGQDLADELRAYIQSRPANRYGLIWTSSVGTPLKMNWLRDTVLNPVLDQLGIRAKLVALGLKAGFYPCRHMVTTELRHAKVPLVTIQNRVGHAPGSSVTDKFYVHDRDSETASDLMAGLLDSKIEGRIN